MKNLQNNLQKIFSQHLQKMNYFDVQDYIYNNNKLILVNYDLLKIKKPPV